MNLADQMKIKKNRLPFAVGAIAQVRGVQCLQPIVLAMIVVLLGLWLLLPRIQKHPHQL
jgi:hypothetical protein